MNAKNNPVAWALLLAELEDIQEHTETLMNDLLKKEAIDDIEYRIDIGHIYSHLNRAWHRSKFENDLTDKEWEKGSEFPTDIEPT